MNSVKILLADAVRLDMESNQMDVVTAFLIHKLREEISCHNSKAWKTRNSPKRGGLNLRQKDLEIFTSPETPETRNERRGDSQRKLQRCRAKDSSAETFRAIWEECGHIWVAESCLKKCKKADSRYYNCRIKSNHISRKDKEKGNVWVYEQAQGDVARKKRKRTEGEYNLCVE